MRKFIFAMLVCIGLVGCNTPPVPTERIVDRFVKVPKELTEKVKVTAPFNPVTYSVLSFDEKEAMLHELIQKHVTSLGVCNARLDGIDAWSTKQTIIYSPTP